MAFLNQPFSGEVWLMEMSTTTRMPFSWHLAMSETRALSPPSLESTWK